jgi:hypothetical protein
MELERVKGKTGMRASNCIQPQPGCLVACALEGWHIDDNNDVPSDTLFYDMEYRSYGTPMSISLEPWYSTEVPSEIVRYCQVEIIQNPSRVRLNTFNW